MARTLTLGQTQRKFSRCVGLLILEAYRRGYELSLGDAYRSPRAFGMIGTFKAYGHPKSNHKRRLAIDLNLFRNQMYMDATEDHEDLGTWWEDVLGPKEGLPLRWGGRFSRPDGNHYSCMYRGQM